MKKHHLTLTAVRGIIYFVTLLLCSILQFIILPRTALPFPILLLIPVTAAFTMHENEFAGLFLGLLSGILWDAASPLTDGMYALIFPAVFLLTGLLTRYVLRNTYLTAALFTAVYSLIPPVLGLFYMKEKLTGALLADIIKTECIPAVITSIIILIPAYFLASAIYRRFSAERAKEVL